MTPKQQAIKKAYGDKYDTFKDEMDENGWVIWEPSHKGHPRWNKGKEFYEWYCPDSDFDQFRPKSLNGIENNNGWVSVEERMPDDEEHCWIWLEVQGELLGFWDEIDGAFVDEYGAPLVPTIEVTHWQPVTKPEAPLY